MVILLGIYLLGVLILMRSLPKQVLELIKEDDETKSEKLVTAFATSLIVAMFWPIIVLAALVFGLFG